MADIFISYSKPDRDLVLKLSTFLESKGWSVWWDKSLTVGEAFRDEIMKQLATARAVITIWTETSVKSDWVRAEAGRAKADSKLIPVKIPELSYDDIPLPFGEMHTENITSPELIRAAIVGLLAKPASPQTPFKQLISTFEYQTVSWIGVVGASITLFANFKGVLDFAHWVGQIVLHWHMWTEVFWTRIFSLVHLKVPRELAPILSFLMFSAMLVVGANLTSRRRVQIEVLSNQTDMVRRAKIKARYKLTNIVVAFIFGVTLYPVAAILVAEFLSDGWVFVVVWVACAIGFATIHLLIIRVERLWLVASGLLFFLISLCLLFVPFSTFIMSKDLSDHDMMDFLLLAMMAFQCCWMPVFLFSPLRPLTRRLFVVVLGVVTLLTLNEISKLYEWLSTKGWSLV